MIKPITNHAVQAIAFIMLRDAGIHAVDACMALADGQAANQMARAAEDEANAMNAAVKSSNRTSAIQLLKSGWIPDGWES